MSPKDPDLAREFLINSQALQFEFLDEDLQRPSEPKYLGSYVQPSETIPQQLIYITEIAGEVRNFLPLGIQCQGCQISRGLVIRTGLSLLLAALKQAEVEPPERVCVFRCTPEQGWGLPQLVLGPAQQPLFSDRLGESTDAVCEALLK